MGAYPDRRLPVALVLVIIGLLAFGCLEQPSGPTQEADNFGPKVEALNARIAAATSASAINAIQANWSSLDAEARADEKYSSYLPLLDAQNLTMQFMLAYFEFQTTGSEIGQSGIDCEKDYSSFISAMKAANTTANSALSKARSYQSSNPNSTANLLVSAINKTSPDTMAFYATLLEDNLKTDCPAKMQAPSNYTLPLSFEDALSIAMSEAGDEYFIYGDSTALPAGTVVTAPRALDDVNLTLKNSTWFFFLDSQPWAPFAHDVRYIMIDVATGTYYVANESMYPEIDGAPRWMTIDERQDESNILYPEGMGDTFALPANLSTPAGSYFIYSFPLAAPDLTTPNSGKDVNSLECCLEKKKYALLMTGSNDSQFQANTKMMYDYLKGAGYGDDQIQYLTSTAGLPGSDGMTTVANLAAALNWLKANAKCCDEIFIYLAGHGSKDPVFQVKHKTTGQTAWIRSAAALASPADWERTGGTGNYHRIDVNRGKPGGGGASSQALYDFISGMQTCKITVMYQSCHSGAAAPTLGSLPGVSVLTPVDSEHSSYGIGEAAGDWKVGSFFTQAYLNAKTKDNATADTNHDGSVSEKEAFDRANRVNHDTIEGIRTSLNAQAAGEPNETKKRALQRKARELEEQNGVFKEGPTCRCCFVNCSVETNYLCVVFEGRNKPNCPDCRKVGDYCGPTVTAPPVNDTPLTGNDTGGTTTGGTDGGGTTVGGGTGGETPPEDNVTAVCGDGLINGAEQCDHGNYSTNKCAEGTYCNKCQCKKLETSVVCGDGKISSPGEDCDGGSVDYKICPSGYTCSICKCVPTQAQCGDGTVTPPEECDHGNTYTKDCPDGKTCYSCKCYLPDDVPEEAYCGNNKREGTEQCDGTDRGVCSSDENCQSCACVPKPDEEPPEEAVCGNGDVEAGEQCEDDNDCSSGQHCSSCQCVSTPTYCGDGIINNNEQCDGSSSGCDGGGVCSAGCTCVYPPSLNCDYICSQTSGAQLIGTGLSSQSQCTAAAQSYFPSQTCYTTCRYSWFYRVDNIAGFASCCCGMKKQFPCTDCPGENPYCQPAETVCPANAPSWYQP